MAPNPQTVIIDSNHSIETFERPSTGDEVVISGMAGLYPKSENTMELMENLYNNVDMVEEVNCNIVKHPGLPKYYGKIDNVDKFDAQFFRVTPLQATTLDPLSRKFMENAFSAIYDSGINPLSISGTKLGVFVGSSYSDAAIINMFDILKHNSFNMSGCSKSMCANRVSYWIDGKGPSFGLDQACTSSMACLEIAYNSMLRGDCDAALVGGCNTCVHPLLSLNLKNAGHVCLDGKTKCFDKNGDGYVRAEAISTIFLQKAKDAKRIYTELYHIKGKYFMRPDANYLPIRNSEDIENFLREFYEEIKVSPSEVEYVEAFGIGIAEADGNELNAIGNIFAKSRTVKVGSIKSNMGNAEAANGLCSVTKLCLAYNQGELPANLHYNEPQDHITAIRDGRIRIVTENAPFNRGYTAINTFSFTGNNIHVLFKGHFKNKDNSRYKSSIPRLVLLSGREEHGVNKIMDKLNSKPIDPEQIALLHNIYKFNIPGHTGRSYTILETNEQKNTVSLARSFEFYSGTSRPVWFLYSGMGSQWNCMGAELLRIPIFAAAIERCRNVLEPLGVDIVKILTDPDKTIFDNILNSMVGISAMQIGLTDVLKAIGIIPDNIIGHSIGELGCAYADDCFTAEEMILSSYKRGLVSIQTPFIRGSMAAVGLGYNDILPLCPSGIEVACHNSAISATISGPADIMKQFISDLTNRGIFAREVACANIAYHSHYIAAAGPKLLSSMKEMLKQPKLRSEKWISTSVPQENWDQECAKYASSEYFTNNLLNPVLFEENARLIPNDAIIIELAPHGLLQAIIKKSHSECINIPLTKRATPDPVSFLLKAIGKLYQTGLNPEIEVLYPKVEFPVSTETPFLSHLVEWEHSVDWPQTVVTRKTVKETSARKFLVSIYDDEYKYMEGHVRNGINEVPETTLLVFIWQTLAMYRGKFYKDMSITFYDVTFHCQLKIEAEDVLRLRITIQDSSNRFEVCAGNTCIVSGFIKDVAGKVRIEEDINTGADEFQLSGADLYCLLRMKGYNYQSDFQSIHLLNITRNTAYIKWTGEWATFLDSLLQLNVFPRDHDGVSTPVTIKKLSINVDGHKYEDMTTLDGNTCYKARMTNFNTLVKCGGVELDGVIFDDKPRLETLPDVVVTREFIPYELNEDSTNLATAISINLQLVADNAESNKIRVLELVNSPLEDLSNIIKEISEKIVSYQFDVNCVISNSNVEVQDVIDSKLIVAHNLLQNETMLNILHQSLNEDAFVLSFEQNKPDLDRTDFKVITIIVVAGKFLVLLKKGKKYDRENVVYISIDDDNTFSWVSRVQNELQKSRRVVLVSERQPYNGLLGFVKHLKESNGIKIGLVVVDDCYASSFNPENDAYKKQLQKNLTFNILKKGQWGSYYYVPETKTVQIQNMNLTTTAVGDLDHFTWVETPKPSGNHVQVSYAGLSARDCQKALGNVRHRNLTFGMDFSGIDCKGKKVMGLVTGGALGSSVEADPSLLWPVPEHWSLEDAATVPLPYIQAYYILTMKGHISKNQRVFVTSGAGALGQAMISICHSLDCTVFTTVSDEKKKIFLLKLFPKLKDENIAYSRHDTFFTKVRDVTKNGKCDIVVNTTSGHLRKAAMKCVAAFGKFIDIEIDENRDFGMSYLWDGKNYLVVHLSALFKPEHANDRKSLQMLMVEGIRNGTVKPLTRVVYSLLEVSRAFKLVSSSKHRGRALIKIIDSKSLSLKLNIIPRMTFSNGVHIIICEVSYLGLELIDYLIRRGANRIMIHLKTQHQTNYLNAKAMSWKKLDVTIELNSENLQTKEGCERLLKSGQKLGAVTGIFIVQDYKDKVDTVNIEPKYFKSTFNDTVVVTANLDMVSRNICSGLSEFVLVSVSSQNIGSEYATSACERICEARSKIGLPALLLRATISNMNIRNRDNLLSKLELSTLSSLYNAMDSSLKLKHRNVLTFNLIKINNCDITKKLERILGVNIDDIDENLTLGEMHVNDMVIEEIQSVICDRVTYSTEKLLEMTVGRLKHLQCNINRSRTNFDGGLGAFFNHVVEDEYVAVDAVIPMNTQLISLEEDGYIDRSKNHLMIIPGFNGNHQVFRSVAERLKIRAATLQLGPDVICESIPEMAKTLTNRIKLNFEMQSKFYIFGYSFGVNVALEVAKLLETEGQTGVIYCLDSSPDALKSHLKAYLGSLTGAQLQNAILVHMYHLMTGQEGVELKQELEKIDNWSDKMEICMKKLGGFVHFSIKHRRTMLESAYNRIILAREYEPDFKLDSDLVLIKGIPHPRVEELAEDYSLSKYTNKPVKVFQIESDHALAPYDVRVPKIVNKMLDSNLLEAFKKKNLCEFYYL